MRAGAEPSYGAITFLAGGLRAEMPLALRMWQPDTASVRAIHRVLMSERSIRMRAAVAQPFVRNSQYLILRIDVPTPTRFGWSQKMLSVYMAQTNVGRSAS